MQISTFIICFFGVFISASSHLALDTSTSVALPRIVNGYVVDISEIPYQAILRSKGGSGWIHKCGAAIISNRAVLSAAHCVLPYVSTPSSLRVVTGTSYRLSGGNGYNVYRIFSHEEYSNENLINDIGLVVTSKTITFNSNAQPVAIAPPNLNLAAGTEALVSGYGNTAFQGSASSVLLAAKVNVVDNKACSQAYLRIAEIYSGMLCASGSNPTSDACQGDSGGPLVANGYLIGIVSFGEGCADENYPGVYTRVSEYYTWIQNKLNKI